LLHVARNGSNSSASENFQLKKNIEIDIKNKEV